MKRSLPLLLVLLLAFVPRLLGIGFGLPDADNAYSYNPDEWTPLQALRSMNPRELDFNPHYWFNPTFHYYLCGGVIFAAALAGQIRIDGTESFYFEHPEHVARMILTGRLVSALFGVATIWLVYLLARRLSIGRGFSLLAALFLALHTSHIIHAHYFTVNTAVTFWSVLALLGMERWIRKGGASSLLWTGVAIGIATSTKYSGALLGPLALLAGVFRYLSLRGGRPAALAVRPQTAGGNALSRTLRETATIGGLAVFVFLLGTPYIVLAFREFIDGFRKIGDFVDVEPAGGREILGPFLHVVKTHLAASTPPLLIASLFGFWLALREGRPLGRLVAAWAAAFTVISLWVGSLSTDGRFLPLFPAVAVLSALALERLAVRRPVQARVAALFILAVLALHSAVITGRFVGPLPQQTASDWARTTVTGSPRVNLAGSAIYYAPDFVLREALQEKNAGAYERQTAWQFTGGLSYKAGRAAEPDVVFLTMNLPFKPQGIEWLSDPAYREVAAFPGKVRWFGKRVHLPLDLYDVDIHVLERKPGTGPTPPPGSSATPLSD